MEIVTEYGGINTSVRMLAAYGMFRLMFDGMDDNVSIVHYADYISISTGLKLVHVYPKGGFEMRFYETPDGILDPVIYVADCNVDNVECLATHVSAFLGV